MRFIPGIALLCTTILALYIANSKFKYIYYEFFNDLIILNHFSVKIIINDFLMAIFFLVVGCEIKKEILYGNLCDMKRAALPVISAIGGVIFPALIYAFFNANTSYLKGINIPISTDIAFAVGAFAIFKNKIGSELKIFLLSLAVVDDLLAICMIAVLHSSNLRLEYAPIVVILIGILYFVNKKMKKDNLPLYLFLGGLLCMSFYICGIHPTISGVVLAIFIPSKPHGNREIDDDRSLLDYIICKISPFCNLLILPIFAFANTGITINLANDMNGTSTIAMGIIIGLVIGKPIGIMLFSYLSTKMKIAKKSSSVSWRSMFVVSVIAGIGFTMSILSAEIAFSKSEEILNTAKISILLASVLSCVLAFFFVNFMKDIKVKEGCFENTIHE